MAASDFGEGAPLLPLYGDRTHSFSSIVHPIIIQGTKGTLKGKWRVEEDGYWNKERRVEEEEYWNKERRVTLEYFMRYSESYM